MDVQWSEGGAGINGQWTRMINPIWVRGWSIAGECEDGDGYSEGRRGWMGMANWSWVRGYIVSGHGWPIADACAGGCTFSDHGPDKLLENT